MLRAITNAIVLAPTITLEMIAEAMQRGVMSNHCFCVETRIHKVVRVQLRIETLFSQLARRELLFLDNPFAELGQMHSCFGFDCAVALLQSADAAEFVVVVIVIIFIARGRNIWRFRRPAVIHLKAFEYRRRQSSAE